VPFCCDHGANVPIVATLLPRPGGDGVHLYASGTQEGSVPAITMTAYYGHTYYGVHLYVSGTQEGLLIAFVLSEDYALAY
jgi:hypothetical protein